MHSDTECSLVAQPLAGCVQCCKHASRHATSAWMLAVSSSPHLRVCARVVYERLGVCCEPAHCAAYVLIDLCNLVDAAGLLRGRTHGAQRAQHSTCARIQRRASGLLLCLAHAHASLVAAAGASLRCRHAGGRCMAARPHQQRRGDALLNRQHDALAGEHADRSGAQLRQQGVQAQLPGTAAGLAGRPGRPTHLQHTLIASIAYSTWNSRPSGLNVFTPRSYSLRVRNIAGAGGAQAARQRRQQDEVIAGGRERVGGWDRRCVVAADCRLVWRCGARGRALAAGAANDMQVQPAGFPAD